MLDSKLYTPREISSWQDIIAYELRLPKPVEGIKQNWIFRGQKSHDKFDFASSLERAAYAFGVRLAELQDREAKLLREFKRKLHHYTSDIPNVRDDLEWLAIMQHYGAPTRLLDWTYSFYVAAYFALENADEKGCDVWALNAEHFSARTVYSGDDFSQLKREAERRKKDPSRNYEDPAHMLQNVILEELLKRPVACVHSANPFRLNERLTIQQGVFLFPGDIGVPFEENLSAREYMAQSSDNLVKFKIKTDVGLRVEIIKNLYRMNISRATLFPGLVGFAESLRTRLPSLPEIDI